MMESNTSCQKLIPIGLFWDESESSRFCHCHRCVHFIRFHLLCIRDLSNPLVGTSNQTMLESGLLLRAERSPVYASWKGNLGWRRRLITLTCKWTTFGKGGWLRQWGWRERWEWEVEQWSLLMIDPYESGLLRCYSEGKPQKNARLTSLPI